MKLLVSYGSAFVLHAAVATGVLLQHPRATGAADHGWSQIVDIEPMPTAATFRDTPSGVSRPTVQALPARNTSPIHVVAVSVPAPASTHEDEVPLPVAPPRFHATAIAAVTVAAGPLTFDESEVTERARCIAAAEPTYPAEALDDGVTPTKPLHFDLVVDSNGAVVEARPLDHAGHGFDESAMAALRHYRFAPAKRNGEAVRVRMPWSVEFRLR